MNKIIFLLLINVFIILILSLTKKLIHNYYKRLNRDDRQRFKFNSRLNFTVVIINIIVALAIWYSYISSFITLISFISAALLYALREIIYDFYSGLYIKIKKPFVLEDRIQIKDFITGDVIKIEPFCFTLLEVENTEDGQSTGKLVNVPNSFVFNYSIKNYTKAFKYVWHEINIVVDMNSDLSSSKKAIYKILNRNYSIEKVPKRTENQIRNSNMEYRIYYNQTEPIIYTKIVENGIELKIRFLINPKKIRSVEDSIYCEILEEYKKGTIKLNNNVV